MGLWPGRGGRGVAKRRRGQGWRRRQPGWRVCKGELLWGGNIGPGTYLTIVNTDFLSFFLLCSLLFTHFGDTYEAKILFPNIFWHNLKQYIF